MPNIQERLDQAVTVAETASQKLHQTVNGGETETVTVESGEIPTVAKAIKDTYDVPEGRYEIRATRLDDKDTSSRAGHEIRWSSAKGYIISEKDYGNVTLLAIIMKATDNLSQRSSRLVNCIVTRKLNTWSPLSGWSPSVEPTRSIAWALADILKASYGANLKDNAIDLQALIVTAEELLLFQPSLKD